MISKMTSHCPNSCSLEAFVYPSPRVYTGMLGQIGDIIVFTATARRIRELYPNCQCTFAVSFRYREAGELVKGLPYVDKLFVTQLYFEKLTPEIYSAWDAGEPVDLRGDDEIEEQRHYDIVLETRSKPKRMPWWEHGHLVSERAHMVGVPGPIDLQTDICIPPGTNVHPHAVNKIVIHNDPNISSDKAWSWLELEKFADLVGRERVVLLGGPGPRIPGTLDLRERTTLCEAAAVVEQCACYVGIDSGLLWIAASLKVPCVGLFGTSYVPAYENGHPCNPNATYLQVEGSPATISAEAVCRAVCARLVTERVSSEKSSFANP